LLHLEENAMRLYQMADSVRYGLMNTEELRETFLLEDFFQPGEIEFAYVDLDRTVIGSAVPAGSPLKLETEPELRAEFFLERRELGVLNVGSCGTVTVDGKTFEMDKLDCLYVGPARGTSASRARTQRSLRSSICSAIPRTQSIRPQW
jgi:4-deoxy-L-threo-5-hexosulose-uronate ketol-isomerase